MHSSEKEEVVEKNPKIAQAIVDDVDVPDEHPEQIEEEQKDE